MPMTMCDLCSARGANMVPRLKERRTDLERRVSRAGVWLVAYRPHPATVLNRNEETACFRHLLILLQVRGLLVLGARPRNAEQT